MTTIQENGETDEILHTPTFGKWIVLVCSVLTIGIGMGLPISLSVMFLDWQETFQVSRAQTAVVLSTCVGILFGGSMVPGYVMHRYGARLTLLIGSVLATIGMVLSIFATSIDFLVVTVGVVGGTGFCFITLPVIPCVTIVFTRYKTMVIALCITSVGIINTVNPYLLRFLIDHYTWRGVLSFLACMSLNTCVTGMVITSTHLSRTKTVSVSGSHCDEVPDNQSHLLSEGTDVNDDVRDDDVNKYDVRCGDANDDDVRYCDVQNGCVRCDYVIDDDNVDKQEGNTFLHSSRNENNDTFHNADKFHSDCENVNENGNGKDARQNANNIQCNKLCDYHRDIEKTDDVTGYSKTHNVKRADVTKMKSSNFDDENRYDIQNESSHTSNSETTVSPLIMRRPEKDENIIPPNSNSESSPCTDVQTQEKPNLSFCMRLNHSKWNFFTDLLFCLVLQQICCNVALLYCFSSMLMDFARTSGFHKDTGVDFLMVVFASSIGGRLLVASTDLCPRIHSVVVLVILAIPGGMTLFFLSFVRDYDIVLGLLVVLGVSLGGQAALYPKCVLDMDSVTGNTYSIAFGFVCSVEGMVDIAVPILIGYSADITGSHYLILIIMGIIAVTSSTLLIAGFIYTRRKRYLRTP